jgi:hypothetical protein
MADNGEFVLDFFRKIYSRASNPFGPAATPRGGPLGPEELCSSKGVARGIAFPSSASTAAIFKNTFAIFTSDAMEYC